MRTIAIVNQKGGCGKTTTAINLAALYAKRGLRTLLVDMDPQSHCAAGLGVPEARIEYSIGDALLADHTAGFDGSSLIWEVARNLFLAPSTVMLTALEAPGGGLHQLPDKDRRLESLLNTLGSRFDRCLIDCPPTIGLLTFNAMRAARESLIPVETGFFSLRGAERQWVTIQRLIAHIGRPIACHLLPTLHDPASQLARNILAALRRQFAGQILPAVIHVHEELREAASFGQPVLEYAPQSRACADFETLADWLEEHAARPSVEIEVMAAPPSAPLGSSQRGALQPGPARGASQPEHGLAPELAVQRGPTACSPTGGRAAELARRMHELATRNGSGDALARDGAAPLVATDLQIEHHIDGGPARQTAVDAPAVSPRPAARLSLIEAAVKSQPAIASRDELTHVYGVRQTTRGVLFVQPTNASREVSIAGDFNHWSPTASPMRPNQQLGVFETIIDLSPGSYQYRVVIDGQWVADPYNHQRQLNSYGEPNSVVVVQ